MYVYRYLVTLENGVSTYVYRYNKNSPGVDRFSISNNLQTVQNTAKILEVKKYLIENGYPNKSKYLEKLIKGDLNIKK